MLKSLTRRISCGLTVVLVAAFASPAPASADSYNGECGSGYGVVNSASVSGGTVHLAYNNSNGRNCVVVTRSSPGSAMDMDAALKRSDSGSWKTDPGSFTSYAGPVYLDAAGQCVDWGGSIGGEWVVRNGTNCG